MPLHLQRFKDAQDQAASGFEAALSEIRGGGKRSHWIWYVFPQLSGLGQSPAARLYGLDGVSEASDYLQDPLLRGRLLAAASAVAERAGRGREVSLSHLMGSSIDVSKLVSSMTLFGSLAKQLRDEDDAGQYAALARAAEEILGAAEAEGYPRCQFTLDRVR